MVHSPRVRNPADAGRLSIRVQGEFSSRMWTYVNTRDYSDETGLVVLYILNEWFFLVSMG